MKNEEDKNYRRAEARIGAHERRIDRLDRRASEVNGDLSDITAAAVALDGRVDALETADTALDGRLDTLEAASNVPTSRTISTTAPLTGGGDLSLNRLLAVSTFVASGGSHATGIVPDPGATAGTAALLREDSTWVDFVLEVNTSPSSAQLGTVETKVNFHDISPNNSPSVPLAANVLVVGDVVEITAQGIGTVQNSTDSYIFGIEWGGTTLCTTGTMDPSGTTNQIITVAFRGVVQAIGASGVIIGFGIIEVFTRASTTVVAHRVATGSGGTSGTTVDTTAAVTIGISVDRSTTSDDSDSARLDWISLKVRRKMPG